MGVNYTQDRCVKTRVTGDEKLVDMNGCKLTCGEYGAIWPQPSGAVDLSDVLVDMVPDSVNFTLNLNKESEKVRSMFSQLKEIFQFYLFSSHPAYDHGKSDALYTFYSCFKIINFA